MLVTVESVLQNTPYEIYVSIKFKLINYVSN
jgi:hypothetical protein